MTSLPKPETADRMIGLTAFTQKRKRKSREQLLAAATELFRSNDYYSVSIDDIAGLAGVSRMTFYRHFRSRAAILTELFEHGVGAAMPQLLAIRDQDFADPTIVRSWIAGIFDAEWPHRRLLLAFTQAAKIDREIIEATQQLLRRFVSEMGKHIPAFAVSETGDERRCWIEGWLILYEILDQSNRATLDMGIGRDPLVIDILTERFTGFVTKT